MYEAAQKANFTGRKKDVYVKHDCTEAGKKKNASKSLQMFWRDCRRCRRLCVVQKGKINALKRRGYEAL